jgi:hypothetical protein
VIVIFKKNNIKNSNLSQYIVNDKIGDPVTFFLSIHLQTCNILNQLPEEVKVIIATFDCMQKTEIYSNGESFFLITHIKKIKLVMIVEK